MLFFLVVVWGIWSGAARAKYHRHVIDECGRNMCTEMDPDCVIKFSRATPPLSCMNAKNLCPLTIKHFLDLNDIDFDEYVVFDEIFIDTLWALPPPGRAGNTSWIYLRNRQFKEDIVITFRPHSYPDYVFLMTDSDYERCVFLKISSIPSPPFSTTSSTSNPTTTAPSV